MPRKFFWARSDRNLVFDPDKAQSWEAEHPDSVFDAARVRLYRTEKGAWIAEDMLFNISQTHSLIGSCRQPFGEISANQAATWFAAVDLEPPEVLIEDLGQEAHHLDLLVQWRLSRRVEDQAIEKARDTQVRADHRGGRDEQADLVTLDQAAAMVHRSKRTLERHKTKGTLPDPAVQGGAGGPTCMTGR